MIRNTLWAAGIVVLFLGCGQRPEETTKNTTATDQAPLRGFSARDTTFDETLPARAVGLVSFPNGLCTGTAIQRDIVLTAGHCICGSEGADLDDASFQMRFRDAAGNIQLSGPNSIDFPFRYKVRCPGNVTEPSYAAEDTMIIRLQRPLTLQELPVVPAVYTAADFLDKLRNSFPPPFGEGEPFLQAPFEFTGFASTFPIKRTANPQNGLHFTNKRVFDGIPFYSLDGIGWWIHDGIDTIIPVGRTTFELGDSGGPLTVRIGGQTTVIGNMSLGHPNVVYGLIAASPTWENGRGNGKFIQQFINDADGDQVSDNLDNCPPSRCVSPERCRNPGQEDGDGDLIGDACDNCLGLANASQRDLDSDRIGDACDVCPERYTSSSLTFDTDGDGVENACDSCTAIRNAPLACQSDAACAGARCILEGTLRGRCSDDGRSCGGSVGCVSGFCQGIGNFGVCSRQTDDGDGDGIGNACDRCSFTADANLQLNSNAVAESRQSVVALNDVCDAVPHYTSRPIMETSNSNAASVRTLFSSFAGVGRTDENAGATSFTGSRVGFRHCNCLDFVAGGSRDFNSCMQSDCSSNPAEFDASETNWVRVTLAATAQNNLSTAPIASGTLNLILNPTYPVGQINCTESFAHQPLNTPNEGGRCRLGAGQILHWFHQVDMDAGRVPFRESLPPFPDPEAPPQFVTTTAGIFWSHGERTAPITPASSRDTVTAGNLRDHYVYVSTPSRYPRLPRLVPIPPFQRPLICRNIAQCLSPLTIDWLRPFAGPGAIINPVRMVGRPFVIQPSNGTLIGVRRTTEGGIDINPGLTIGARNTLSDPNRMILNPVEPSATRDAQLGGTQFISINRSWSPATSSVQGFHMNEETLDVQFTHRFDSGPPAEGVPPGPHFRPSDRVAAHALFSKLENAVYLIGGSLGEPDEPVGEVWRLDLDTQLWTHVFMPIDVPQVSVADVRAAGYDSSTRKLVVIDGRPAPGLTSSRLVIFDTAKERSSIAARLELGQFSKLTLAATGDSGRFILVGTRVTGSTETFTAYQFRVGADDTVTWEGSLNGTGIPVAEPIATAGGVELFINRGSEIDSQTLTPSSFTGSGPPADLSVCTALPVVVAPPAVTVTDCSSPTLTPPTVTSSCGPVTIMNDAPGRFGLGTKVVTWSIDDALGRTVTVQQSVTTVLGDDPSCCPLGMNVILGTSNNDTLHGTANADCILGLGAQDTIFGNGGDDVINGGDGNDVIRGGIGNDTIAGGSAQDSLFGEAGNDTLNGGQGDDQCRGGPGNDVLFGGDNQDLLLGEDGTDQLFGEGGDDRLNGGLGTDVLNGGPNNDTCAEAGTSCEFTGPVP